MDDFDRFSKWATYAQYHRTSLRCPFILGRALRHRQHAMPCHALPCLALPPRPNIPRASADRADPSGRPLEGQLRPMTPRNDRVLAADRPAPLIGTAEFPDPADCFGALLEPGRGSPCFCSVSPARGDWKQPSLRVEPTRAHRARDEGSTCTVHRERGLGLCSL